MTKSTVVSTKIWLINQEQLVIADTIEDTIRLHKDNTALMRITEEN